MLWLILLAPLAIVLIATALLERRTRRSRLPVDLRHNSVGLDDRALNEAAAAVVYDRFSSPGGYGGP